MTELIPFIIAVALLGLVFAIVWWIDARRSRREAGDPERLRQPPAEHHHDIRSE